ncbi:hypothetical protein BH09ACT8_BH09ACT8_33630 [soil metagenome]
MQVFIGSEALTSGSLTPDELRSFHIRVLPGIYALKRTPLSLRDLTEAAWLWSRRRGVIAGLAASALHGTEWIDDDVAIELIHPNCKPPSGVSTRRDAVLAAEIASIAGMCVTTPARTAFDLARRDSAGTAVARLDALTRAADVKPDEVLQVAQAHAHVRGICRLPTVLDLVDAGAASPQETRLRLLLTVEGFPRPQTRFPCRGRQAGRATTSTWGGLSSWSRSNTTAGNTASTAISTERTSNDWNTFRVSAGSWSGR